MTEKRPDEIRRRSSKAQTPRSSLPAESTDGVSAQTTEQGDTRPVISRLPTSLGSNQTHMRAHNERLVLTLIRQQSLSRAEIARLTGLSAQTITLIIRQLESEQLITYGDPVRGRVGQPSVPLQLNADGAFFIGLKIGRRSSELILLDFNGGIRFRHEVNYHYPAPEELVKFASSAIEACYSGLGRVNRTHVYGIGIAMPDELWNWLDRLDAPLELMQAWQSIDIAAVLSKAFDLPAFCENDATAACGAELTFGCGRQFESYAYFFVGYFIGGGVVIDNTVYTGRTGRAGALGSIPVYHKKSRKMKQLIDLASLHVLERALSDVHDPDHIPQVWDENTIVWNSNDKQIGEWLDGAASAIACAITSVSATLDLEAIIVDGSFPDSVRDTLVDKTTKSLNKLGSNGITRGISPPKVLPGTIGPGARALGAARLPLYSRFLIDQSVLTHSGV